MTRFRHSVVPAYLLLCLLLGGSGQGIWSNAGLQLIAILVIAAAVVAGSRGPIPRHAGVLIALSVAALLLPVLQLIPLPPAIWSSFPGRDVIETGYSALGYSLPWLPVSMTPHRTLETAYALLPPLAVLVGILGLRAYRESWIASAIVAGALGSVLLAAVQVGSGGLASWAYLYPFTNTGAVGFFANRNHMANLLVVAIPFAVALFASRQPGMKGRGSGFAMAAVGAGGLLLVLVGLVLNASLAALALSVPVAALSASLLPVGWRARQLLLSAGGVALVAGMIALTASSLHPSFGAASELASFHSRGEMWSLTLDAIASTFPIGTGLGSFVDIYAMHENPAEVTTTYVNHAHNDYLELVLEAGLPGLLLILAFLVWWAVQATRVWRSPSSSQFARAATIASAAILAHSVVDYPLRTAAIAAVFAACTALMAPSVRQRDTEKVRHVIIA